jgi:hypothetical protein
LGEAIFKLYQIRHSGQLRDHHQVLDRMLFYDFGYRLYASDLAGGEQTLENRRPGSVLSPSMLLIDSSTFCPSARTPMRTKSESGVALRSSRNPAAN